MIDPYLTAIVENVESRNAAVPITVALTSGAVVGGFVRRSQFFASVTRNDLNVAVQKATPRKGPDSYTAGLAEKAERVEDALSKVEEQLGDSDFITLSDVKVVWSNGDGLLLNTFRLNVNAIAAWWITPGRVVKGDKDKGGFWAVGVTF